MTANKKQLLQKIICLALALVLAAIAGVSFYDQRHYKETVVVSDALTEVRWLSDYVPMLKGTYGDTPIFVFDSGVEGGSVLYCGGTHPYEPATSLSAFILMENIQVEKGVVYVIPQCSYSATTLGVQGNAYPSYYTIETEWGEQKYKIGERNTNPLDQWPDNFTYINYPSGQSQAYNDLRNLNRCYPGRLDGTFTERVAYAIMEFIRTENIDMSIDCHEASIMYPVVGTYVAHDDAMDIAMMAAMDLSATSFDMKIEQSPKSLKGFTHREWGDYSDTLAILMETPEPFIDRIVGPITEDLMMTGKDLFLSYAGDKGLTYVKYTEENDYSWPMNIRVGRHLSGAAKAVYYMNMFFPEKEVIATWPSYEELVEKDCGAFLHDPAAANPDQVYKF
ncbi:MAG: succinylglutamate desuccinylase [Eubacteriales bacterium]|nr:succinylglutamate desuccinylase [Eubacteriales bacterium]